jgi:hypothetical protein
MTMLPDISQEGRHAPLHTTSQLDLLHSPLNVTAPCLDCMPPFSFTMDHPNITVSDHRRMHDKPQLTSCPFQLWQ